jgi:hypothetical protein
MSMAKDVAVIAAECIKTPHRASKWSKQLGRYVGADHPDFHQASSERLSPPPLSSEFKLVFLTAAAGTFIFVALCVITTMVAGKDMPQPLDKLIQGLFDLAKIGFGAVVGLLGAQSLHRENQT